MSSIISVSQLTNYITHRLTEDIRLKTLTVKGELSEFKIHYASGHAYFTLKDEGAVLKGVMWKAKAERLGFEPRVGMSVLCIGSIAVYKQGGYYQISANELVPAGLGVKFLQQKQLEERLAKLGIFAQERKKSLPALPKKIAVVTSLNGAALQDVLNIMKRRYPVAELNIFPAQVQGESAHLTIASAIKKADMSGSDVIIVTRGGGSYEDLMPFNTEEVAMAISDCNTPVISAVGHETDTTIADHVADMRAPTPSAAAEQCAPTVDSLISLIDAQKDKLDSAYGHYIGLRREQINILSQRLSAVSPYRIIDNNKNKLESLTSRLDKAYKEQISVKYSAIQNIVGKLEALSPYKVLDRGYTLTLKNGLPVTDAAQLTENDEIVIRFRDSAVTAKITGTIKNA
ncbi:MAG: exodeoxyribonuclease VII large subunit [Ruminococcus sp.]|nr:exodeoxyribonuclease VII large subunit [Ruminococcus sp.]